MAAEHYKDKYKECQRLQKQVLKLSDQQGVGSAEHQADFHVKKILFWIKLLYQDSVETFSFKGFMLIPKIVFVRLGAKENLSTRCSHGSCNRKSRHISSRSDVLTHMLTQRSWN